jgi:NAD(P)-dependent dehydrogenase (short-subunit alcohol dehydrogenase family)
MTLATMSLEGKVALVMGAGRNIGRSVALELAERGASVAVNARANADEAQQVASEVRALGRDSVAVVGDQSSRADVDRIVAETTQRLGPIAILVNSAAIRPSQPFLEITESDWQRVLAVNLKGPFNTCQTVLPGMIEAGWGRIINFSGAHAFFGAKNRAHVMSGKMAVHGLTRALATEFAAAGVTVNCVVPGVFDTARASSAEIGDGRQVPEPNRSRRQPPPVGRLGRPQEIGALCAFLASEEAGFITGQSIHANGGVFMT